MSHSLDRILTARLEADLALSAARTLLFELRHGKPSRPHPRGRGWLNAEQVELFAILIRGARHSAEAERLIEERIDGLISEYADDPRDDGLPAGEARAQVRRGVEQRILAGHRSEAHDPHADSRARHMKLACQGFSPSSSQAVSA